MQSESQEHAYVVWSPETRDDCAKLLQLIEKEGVLEEWKDGRRYRYLAIGPFKYWHMYPVINRAQG